ncbi:TRAP transporter small permease [Peribacillus asahii]|uniref:Tripartite AtP-independent periplasmic transporter subunit DctQ n=1 Tax=Peribacillus asahii TaxID=228899 RepID=A0A3T0KWX0_9BACI|nr:TRAP transporter small permease [Peribacillus asahii]AZV44801.1 tripartite AtP-independent periplasmic transporter subunit DctQ [Peribacillus asahii]USK84451.1 TRAP transporter small permease [Peribacillus asahii]
MKVIHKLSNWIYSLEKIIAIILCTIILFALAAGVLYRYVLNAPLTWSDETAIFSLVWLTFIGGSMSIKHQDAPAITLLMDKMKGITKKVLETIGLLTVLAFTVYIFYLACIWLSSPNILVQKSSSMQMPMIIAYLSVPVSFFFMMIHSIDVLINNFTSNEEEVN